MDNSTLLKIVILVGLAVCLIYLCQQNAKPSREFFEDEKPEELPEPYETDDEDEDDEDEDEEDEDDEELISHETDEDRGDDDDDVL